MLESKKLVYMHRNMGYSTKVTKKNRLGSKNRYPAVVSRRTSARLMLFLDLNIGSLPLMDSVAINTPSLRRGTERVRAVGQRRKRDMKKPCLLDQPAAAAFALAQNVATSVATSPPPPMRWSMFHHSVRAVAQPEVTW